MEDEMEPDVTRGDEDLMKHLERAPGLAYFWRQINDLVGDACDMYVDPIVRDCRFPAWNDRSPEEQMVFLRRSYTGKELLAFFRRAADAIESFDVMDPEWDVITEEMDVIWNAIDPVMRP